MPGGGTGELGRRSTGCGGPREIRPSMKSIEAAPGPRDSGHGGTRYSLFWVLRNSDHASRLPDNNYSTAFSVSSFFFLIVPVQSK